LLVCHCHRICDRTIETSIRQGARTVAEVGDACRAGTGCGGCQETIAGLLACHARDDDSRALPVFDPIPIRLAS
jgi:bacterioferritin-associated ferredoxin